MRNDNFIMEFYYGDFYEKFYWILLIFVQNNKFHAKLFQIDEGINLTNNKLAFQNNLKLRNIPLKNIFTLNITEITF